MSNNFFFFFFNQWNEDCKGAWMSDEVVWKRSMKKNKCRILKFLKGTRLWGPGDNNKINK